MKEGILPCKCRRLTLPIHTNSIHINSIRKARTLRLTMLSRVTKVQEKGLQLYPQTANGNPLKIEESRFVDKVVEKLKLIKTIT